MKVEQLSGPQERLFVASFALEVANTNPGTSDKKHCLLIQDVRRSFTVHVADCTTW